MSGPQKRTKSDFIYCSQHLRASSRNFYLTLGAPAYQPQHPASPAWTLKMVFSGPPQSRAVRPDLIHPASRAEEDGGEVQVKGD